MTRRSRRPRPGSIRAGGACGSKEDETRGARLGLVGHGAVPGPLPGRGGRLRPGWGGVGGLRGDEEAHGRVLHPGRLGSGEVPGRPLSGCGRRLHLGSGELHGGRGSLRRAPGRWHDQGPGRLRARRAPDSPAYRCRRLSPWPLAPGASRGCRQARVYGPRHAPGPAKLRTGPRARFGLAGPRHLPAGAGGFPAKAGGVPQPRQRPRPRTGRPSRTRRADDPRARRPPAERRRSPRFREGVGPGRRPPPPPTTRMAVTPRRPAALPSPLPPRTVERHGRPAPAPAAPRVAAAGRRP